MNPGARVTFQGRAALVLEVYEASGMLLLLVACAEHADADGPPEECSQCKRVRAFEEDAEGG